MWNNLLKTKEKVRYILENYESTRDSDMNLLSVFWLKESGNMGWTTHSTLFFLQNLNRLTSAESIMRCRRKIQEQHTHLRGKNYEIRQAECDLITRQIRLL